jgi:hypothetical protein
MFAPMVSALKNGTLPENSLLRKRFDAALIKKMGVIQTPRAFWPADEKINPPAKQLLWAAILLHDKENFRIVEAIISKELEEKQRVSGEPDSIKALAARVQLNLQAYLREFIELAPAEPFKSTLKKKVQALDLL